MWIGGPIFALRRFLMYGQAGAIGQDAHAYWLTAHTHRLYTAPPGTHDAFLYTPFFAQLIRPAAALPFGWFTVLVIAIDVVCFAWLLAPLGWKWAVPVLFFLASGFVLGNIIGLLTVAAVLGVSGRAGWWSVGYLTKITPGIVGSTWHAFHGEWRNLLFSLAWPGAIAAISYLIWPAAWHQWLIFLSSAGNPVTTARLVVGLILVAVGGRRNWWRAVPVALVLSAPVLGQGTLGYLAGLARLRPRKPASTETSDSRRP